jgi:hypothetical protein
MENIFTDETKTKLNELCETYNLTLKKIDDTTLEVKGELNSQLFELSKNKSDNLYIVEYFNYRVEKIKTIENNEVYKELKNGNGENIDWNKVGLLKLHFLALAPCLWTQEHLMVAVKIEKILKNRKEK